MADSPEAATASLVVVLVSLWLMFSGGLVGLGQALRTLARRCVYVALIVLPPLAVLYFFVRFIKWAWSD